MKKNQAITRKRRKRERQKNKKVDGFGPYMMYNVGKRR
jgi:hypothetical protein